MAERPGTCRPLENTSRTAAPPLGRVLPVLTRARVPADGRRALQSVPRAGARSPSIAARNVQPTRQKIGGALVDSETSAGGDTNRGGPEDRLASWKRIAAYLKHDVNTVQRWEHREGMPVHRHVHD